jgi:Domain of unknown function (DUF4838)
VGRYRLIVLILASSCAVVTSAADVEITAAGKSDVIVSIPVNASPPVRLAADELVRYVKQISGSTLEIRPGELEAKKGVMLMPTRASNARELQIVIDGNTIAIIGNDAQVLHGTYRMLDQLGCRFLAPQIPVYNGTAEIIPSNATLVLHSNGMRASPALKFRKIYVEEGHSHTPENLAQIVEWMPKVGYNTLVVPADYQGNHRVMWDKFRERVTPECQKRGITIEVGGHGYQNFLNADMEEGKLFDQHPDWFGMNSAGVRQKAKGWVFCTSNALAVGYLIDNFVAYVKARPEIQIYDFWPPDGAKWCECNACKAIGSPSDRQAHLIHQVKERMKTARPDLRVEVLAYHTSVYPPEKEKLDKDVLLDFCPINQQFDHQIDDATAEKNADYVKGLTTWRKAFDGDISIYSYYRKYVWDSLPVIIPHYVQKDLQFYAKVPVQGISTYAEPGDWCTYELNHYVLAALAWDPDADVDAIIKKFCAARYGEFASLASVTLDSLGEITRSAGSIPNTTLKSANSIEIDRGIIEEKRKLVDAAAAKAENAPVKRALERLALMCTYAAKDLEIQGMRAAKADAEQVRSKAEELHAFLVQHAGDGVFLIKDQRISPQRMLKRYGAGGATTQRGG